MSGLDWCITLIPVAFIIYMAIYAKRYVRSVADYLAAGRVAGRYVIAVGDLEAGLGVITLVAMVESAYRCGFAVSFWSGFTMVVGLIMSLTGYCTYRFRETRALSIGQFLEMRYNRSLRIFASSLRTLSEILANTIGPAIAARFFVYFLDMPNRITILGFSFPSYYLIIVLVLLLAITVLWPGGTLSLIVTDCFQGLLSYPIFVTFTLYLVCRFSWNEEIVPVMLDRASGESFLNPYDIEQLRDFNIFALAVSVINSIINKASWIGAGSTSAGRTPHEQKMAGILGNWRTGFSTLMCTFLAFGLITLMTHDNFSNEAKNVRLALTERISDELIVDRELKNDLHQKLNLITPKPHQINHDPPFSQTSNPDTPYLDTVHRELVTIPDGNRIFQEYRTLYYQTMFPVAMRQILPPVLMGLFCLLMVMLMISTDDSRIFSSSLTIVQDIIIPLKRKEMSTTGHFKCLRTATVVVSVIFLFGAVFLAQLDYINMYITITTAIWLGGAGPVMIFGLYSRFGTTAGAFASLFTGAILSVSGIILQRSWADIVYPLLERNLWVEPVDNFLKVISSPFNPYIAWSLNPVKFPITSVEWYFLSILGGILAYLLVSWLTCRTPYNLDRMLHRGIYSDHKAVDTVPTPHRTFYQKFCHIVIGITPEYTLGDKIISYAAFINTFVINFLIIFVGSILWNFISPWPAEWWGIRTYIVVVILGSLVGGISTVWFIWGGIRDIRQLFSDLEHRRSNHLDNGRVENHVSLADKAEFEKIEHSRSINKINLPR